MWNHIFHISSWGRWSQCAAVWEACSRKRLCPTLCTTKKVSCSVKGEIIELKIGQLGILSRLIICGCQHSEQPLHCHWDPPHKNSKYFLLSFQEHWWITSYLYLSKFEFHLRISSKWFLYGLAWMAVIAVIYSHWIPFPFLRQKHVLCLTQKTDDGRETNGQIH